MKMPLDSGELNIVFRNCRYFQAGEIGEQSDPRDVDFNFNSCSLGRNLKPCGQGDVLKHPTAG